MSQIERLSLNSERDGLELPLLCLPPDGEIRAVVQIAHGMCEHKDRYVPFMEFLAEHGYATVIHDHRGHGEAARERNELGYFGRDGAQSLVDDVHQVTLWAKSRFPGKKIYLFGHSMGSLAARAYLLKYEGELSGVMLSGSPAYNPAAPGGKLLAQLLGLRSGGRKRSKLLKAITFGPFYRAYPDEGSKCAWLATDKEVVRAYDESPLCGFTFACNGFQSLYTLMALAYSGRVKAKNPELPIHFLSGENDPCRGGDRGFRRAVEVMLRRGYTRVGGRVYEGMRHEILNEPGKAEVYKDVIEKLNEWEAAE
ncbi:MAG: alpha/beta hydrolase [Clostridiales bacterium]|nr:alpha/beta hydrolase [Clostridiales bacterium]OPZ68162.1 MAG: Phospholipase YtpA [Firmicutes bacterium ADurb.Bin467]